MQKCGKSKVEVFMRPENILVFVGEDLLGDGLLKLPFVHALKKMYPYAKIHWWAGYGKTAYKNILDPLVAGIFSDIQENVFTGLSWKSLLKKSPWYAYNFDLIIDTQRDLKETLLLKKIPHKKFISATCSYFFSDYKPKNKKPKSRHLSDTLLFLLELIKGDTIEQDTPPLHPTYIRPMQHYFAKQKKYVGLAPGAGQKHKCWPLGHFIQIAKDLVAQNITPVFILGPLEQSWKAPLEKIVPEALFPLQEHPEWLTFPLYTAGIATYFQYAISNDSGTGHLLALSGKPLISLFGKTNADKVHPLTKKLFIVKAQDYGSKDVKDICAKEVLKITSKIH